MVLFRFFSEEQEGARLQSDSKLKKTHGHSGQTNANLRGLGVHDRAVNNSSAESSESVPAKAYAMTTYQIILHALIIYCAVGVTHLLVSSNAHSTCKCSQLPSTPEDLTGHDLPSSVEPSKAPSVQPSTAPAEPPTAADMR